MSSHSLRRYYYIVGRSCSYQKLHTRLYLKEKKSLVFEIYPFKRKQFSPFISANIFYSSLRAYQIFGKYIWKEAAFIRVISKLLSILQGLSVFVTLRYFESLLFLHSLLFRLKDNVNIVHNAHSPSKMADFNLKIVHFFAILLVFSFPENLNFHTENTLSTEHLSM